MKTEFQPVKDFKKMHWFLKPFACIAIVLCLLSTNSQAQTLEIHHINVGHGDATLIIVRDTHQVKQNYRAFGVALPANDMDLISNAIANSVDLDNSVIKAVMIDFGVGSSQAEKIRDYLGDMGVDKLDYAILSHNHQDHYGGFKSLIEQKNVRVDSAYYRGDGKPTGSPGFNTGFVNVLRDKNIPTKLASVTSTDLLIYSKLNMPNIQLTCIASNGYVFKKRDNTPQVVSSSQNDYGCVWILQYGAFRYYTGGDLSGFNTSSYVNLETPTADSLFKYDGAVFTNWTGTANLEKAHVCSMKLNHHGSSNSSNAKFLYRLSPKTAMISCGEKHDHPTLDVIKDLIGPLTLSDWPDIPGPAVKASSIDSFFVTTLVKAGDARDNVGSPGSKGIIGGDITLVVNDVNIATQSAYNAYWDGVKDVTVLGSTTDPATVRAPNPRGVRKFNCHKVTTTRYITNH